MFDDDCYGEGVLRPKHPFAAVAAKFNQSMTGNKNAAYELFVLDQIFHVASSLLIQTDQNMP